MIDIENEIFTKIATALREKYDGIFVTGEYVQSPSSFPCVSIIESDNAVYRNGISSTETENYATLMYEVNIYSNKKVGKKSECKSIAKTLDTIMASLNFTRMLLNPIQNFEDATIYRICGRYRAIVSKENVIYRR